jgi:hypothetical protein
MMSMLDVKPIPDAWNSHWAVYGRRCCINHDQGDHTHAEEYTSADKCCEQHHPDPVVVEFKAEDFVSQLPEAYHGYQLKTITGPFDRLGRFYKVILEPAET